MSAPVESSVALLLERAASIPGAINGLIRSGLPSLEHLHLGARELVVTGSGIAEGPARFLVQSWDHRARFLPASAFASSPQQGDLRVVFSQALSPHARLALDARHHFTDTLLFTSADEATVDSLRIPRLTTVRLEPSTPEDGLLLRLVGPAVARVAAQLVAQTVQGPTASRLPADTGAIVEAAWQRGRLLAESVRADALLRPVVFLSQGDDGLEWCRALAWKWMEGLWCVEPPVWDVLQFAHGPLQAVYEREVTLITLEPPNSVHLFERLLKTLDSRRHVIVRSSATLPGPLAVFEHDVVVNALLLCALSVSPRDLSRWPALDRDGPLYRLDGGSGG